MKHYPFKLRMYQLISVSQAPGEEKSSLCDLARWLWEGIKCYREVSIANAVEHEH